MSSEWVIQKLSALGTFDRGKSKHRPRDAAHLYGGPYPFIQTGDVTASGGRITSYRQTYSEAGLAQSKLWPINTLCITIAANIAETGLLTFPACFPDSVVGFTADPSKADIRFVEYLFQAYRASVKSKAYGSVQENINLEVLRNLEFPIPSIIQQTKIADFFTLIDDRIALLRETNATLEAIAQALFKSWFVDFDPVHANAAFLENGQAPSLPAEIQALFPSRLVESPQGLIPEGWEVGCIGDVVSVKGGYAFKSADFQDSGLPVIKIKNIVGDGTVDVSDVQKVSETIASKAQRFALQSGDILMAMTGATIGKVGVFVSENEELAYLNQRVAKFENKSLDQKNTWLAFIAFSNAFMTEQIVNAASGSAQPNISSSGIESARLVVPSNKQVLKAFNDLVEPLFAGWINNQKTIKTLANLRDALLPRLISGQLRLPEAEAALAEVG